MAVEQITASLQTMMRRHYEWGPKFRERALVLSCDVLHAFDHMSPQLVVQALLFLQVHPQIIAAMLAETYQMRVDPEFEGVRLDEPVPFNKCGTQGGVQSTFQWNAICYLILSKLVPMWRASGYGVPLWQGRYYTHVVWADNFYLMAS